MLTVCGVSGCMCVARQGELSLIVRSVGVAGVCGCHFLGNAVLWRGLVCICTLCMSSSKAVIPAKMSSLAASSCFFRWQFFYVGFRADDCCGASLMHSCICFY